MPSFFNTLHNAALPSPSLSLLDARTLPPHVGQQHHTVLGSVHISHRKRGGSHMDPLIRLLANTMCSTWRAPVCLTSTWTIRGEEGKNLERGSEIRPLPITGVCCGSNCVLSVLLCLGLLCIFPIHVHISSLILKGSRFISFRQMYPYDLLI